VSDPYNDRQVVNLRQAGISYPVIAETLGISEGEARTRFQRGLAALPREQADEIAHLAMLRMEAVFAYTTKVMTSFHPLVNNGQVMTHPETGEVIHDPVPGLAAAKLQIQAAERLARQYGTDAPTRTVNVTVDAIEQEIRKLEAELGVQAREAGDDAAGGPERPQLAIEAPREDAPPGFR